VFSRVLVANRGEIAVRVIRALHELEIEAVAIYSTADKDSMHVRLADRAVAVGPPPASQSYLNIPSVIAAATTTGCEAIHPGYGFLAENPAFVAACEDNELVFVGPTAEVMARMGDKVQAKAELKRAGVPLVPGSDEDVASSSEARSVAADLGYPVLLKAAAGGGGKGMRIVRSLDELPAALAAARREADSAFGDDRLILERFVAGPRHVEIQLLFDAHGAGVHLGERDCSIQRRHQKILEETPSPGVDEPTRRRLTDAALALGRAVGYVSAGTCEFLLDDRGEIFFLEMNTRLQVEHPVTEAVTGRDVVADQIRIAAGKPLGFTQADVASRGHAIEARLYAEDPDAGFLPATGRIEALHWPAGDGIRVDTGVKIGDDVSDRFDPMLAKIVAHGRDRGEALTRLAGALDATVVLGLTTNLRFLRWLVREPAVTSGQARIDTLERIWPPDDWPDRTAIPAESWQAAARLLGGGWRLNGPRSLRLAAEGEEQTVSPADATEADGAAVVSGDVAHLDIGGRSVAFRLAPAPDVDRAARAAAAHAHAGGSAELVAPMPGAVVTVHVALGESVEVGDPIVTLEAMKMEHVVVASSPGRVTELRVGARDQVARGQLLATIEA